MAEEPRSGYDQAYLNSRLKMTSVSWRHEWFLEGVTTLLASAGITAGLILHDAIGSRVRQCASVGIVDPDRMPELKSSAGNLAGTPSYFAELVLLRTGRVVME
jgi:hypothetical protein